VVRVSLLLRLLLLFVCVSPPLVSVGEKGSGWGGSLKGDDAVCLRCVCF